MQYDKYISDTPLSRQRVDGVQLKLRWAGEEQNISVSVAISVNADGDRKILRVATGQIREDNISKSVEVIIKIILALYF